MSFKDSQANGNAYNNADSFAMAFDEAWQDYSSSNSKKPLSKEDKIDMILQKIQSHPFLKDYPEEAKEVAKFRLRLLNLQ